MRKIISAIFLFLTVCASSQIVERPVPQKLYNNFSKEFPDFLTSEQSAQLEQKLEQFSNETSNQICIVIVDELNELEPAEYATKIINEWGIGNKANNGVVILVKPTTGEGGRQLFIAVGYGLEGAIPDITTKKIREKEMNPYLKQGDYYSALNQGTDVLMKLAKGEINEKDYRRENSGMKFDFRLIIIIIVIIIFILKNLFGGGGGGGRTLSRTGSALFWGSMLSNGLGGGRGFGGGSSGGGFGGFGGGSSGGGGSGGSW